MVQSCALFSGEHDKAITFTGAAGMIHGKCLQSTTIEVRRMAQRTEKDLLDLIAHLAYRALIDWLSDLSAGG